MLKATNINCFAAENIKELPINTVLISINEEDRDLYPLQIDRKDNRVLTLVFSDVTSKYVLPNGKEFFPISVESTLKLLDFINLNKEKNFIVHCAAGVSRSAAVCFYLNLVYGHELKENFWKDCRPNKFVVGQLFVTRHKM
jgi:predicted protein tyrosine phosphatase